MITYVSLSLDKKYISIDVDTIPILKIHLDGDVIMSTSDNRIEYRFTETKCRIILIKDVTYSTDDCIIGQMEIHSDNMSFVDRYEDYTTDSTIESLLSNIIDLYKQERLNKMLAVL